MKLTLRNEDIDQASASLREFLDKYSTGRRKSIRTCLMVEEFLLAYQEKFGPDTEISITHERRLRRDSMVIRIPGISFDPFSASEEMAITHNLLSSVGIDPAWTYKNGQNCIQVTPEQKKNISEIVWILLAVAMGFLLGFAAKSVPGNITANIANNFLAPFSDTLMSFLSATASFLIFFSVIMGICGMGDMGTFHQIGGKMIRNFIFTYFASAVLGLLILVPIFPPVNAGGGAFNVNAIYLMLLDIVPDNIVAPFANSNTLQIIFISVCFGLGMLVLNIKVNGVLELFQQLTQIVQRIVEVIVKLLPITVFISIFQIVALDKLSMLSAVYLFPLLLFVICVAIILFEVLRVSVKEKVNPKIILKKMSQSMMIAFSTASSVAAFTSNVATCEKKYGIDKDMVEVGIPLGQVVFKTGSFAEYLTGGFCLASFYGKTLSVPEIVTLTIVAIILAIATPPIPGAGVSCHMLILSQLGVTVEAIAIVIALNAIIDRIATATAVVSLQLELINVADRTGKLNKDILRREI